MNFTYVCFATGGDSDELMLMAEETAVQFVEANKRSKQSSSSSTKGTHQVSFI